MNYGVNTYGADMFKEQESAGLGRTIIRVRLKEEDGIVTCLEAMIDHEPTEESFAELSASHLAATKTSKVLDVENYAKSNAVKLFTINNVSGWLDSEERGSIRRAASDKADEGRDTFTLYLAGHGFEVSPARVEEILKAVEVYASDCHDVTESHKVAIAALPTVEDVEGYNITEGYPEPLSFTIE